MSNTMLDNSVFLACSTCHELMIKSVNGQLKLRTKIVLLSEDGEARAVCKGCNTEIPIPLKLDTDMVKSMAKGNSPRLYLSKFDKKQ